MRQGFRSYLKAAPLLLACVPAAQVDAASALGSAGATVISPPSVTIASVNIVVQTPNIVTQTRIAAPTVATVSASNADVGNEGTGVATIAGVTVAPVNGGSALSFSVAGDTTSAFVVQLAPTAPPAALSPADSLASTGPALNASLNASSRSAETSPSVSPASGSDVRVASLAREAPTGLILAARPLGAGGRLSIVLSQAPSDLLPGAVSLSVNYN